MKYSEKKKQEWKKLALEWQQFGPPYKPSVARLKLYKKYLKKYALGKRVLILGATPEIRDMLASSKYEVTLLDQSRESVKAMNSMRKTKSKERVIFKNWLDYKPKKKYDVVLGDTTINNLRYKTINRYHQAIVGMLNNNGVFLTEVAGFFRSDFAKFDYMDLIGLYRKNKKYLSSFHNKAYVHYSLWWKEKTKQGFVNVPYIDSKYHKMLSKGILNQKEFERIRMPLRWRGTIFSREQIIPSIRKYFHIVEETYEKEHLVYKYFYRFYVLKKIV